MKKVKRLLILAATVIMLCVISVVASAATYEDLYYEVSNGEVTITGHLKSYANVTSVTIPSSINGYPVTAIGDNAFDMYYNIIKITLPSSLKSIGNRAFYCCEDLKNITIPSGVTTIGEDAFGHCSSITSITIPSGVTAISSDTFSYCRSLTSITIPEGVTSIGQFAFSNCSALTSIKIPTGVTSVGQYAFYECSSLTSLTIPSGVTAIGNYTFYGCSNLTSLTLSSNIKSIGIYAFGKCSKLTSLTLPAGITGISSYTFYKCTSLTSIKIPSGVTIIGSYAFADCTGLTSVTIPASVTTIGGRAFYGCSALSSVTIPDGVTAIGNYTFYKCTALAKVTIPDSIQTIGDYAFYNCSKITSIKIPESVTAIGNYAFCGCSGITKVYAGSADSWLSISMAGTYSNPLRETTTDVELYFNNVLASDITVSADITAVRDYAFYKCKNIKSITITSAITSVGDYAFYNCPKITSITFSEGVTSIGNYAFYNCTALSSVSIPGSVTSVGKNAFYGCENITKIYAGTVGPWLSISLYDNYSNPLYVTKSDNIELYFNNVLATDIIIPDGITAIRDYAFRYCKSITGVTIPSGVTTIGSYAFYYCSALKSVSIPESVVSIGKNVFSACYEIKKVYTGSLDFWLRLDFADSDSDPLYTANNNVELYFNNVLATDITIPADITHIRKYAFANCISVTSVNIPSNVTSIDSYAFSYCEGLKSVTIPDSITSINDETFYHCTALTDITIPDSVTSIGSYAFSYCEALTDITIPDSVTSIGSYAFYVCSSLTSVTIPDSITSISSNAFSNCYNLTDVTIPNSVTTIGTGAFRSCNNLASIVIPDSVTTIGARAFYSCSDLESINLPDSVTYIDEYVFFECTRLAYVVIPDSVTEICSYAFYNCSNLTTIKIPTSVTTIKDSAFINCTAMANVFYTGTQTQWDSISISYGNDNFVSANRFYQVDENYKIVDLALLSKDGSTLYACAPGNSYYVVPDTVTTITTNAFDKALRMKVLVLSENTRYFENGTINAPNLLSIYIPSTVKYIYSYGFSGGCPKLTDIYYSGTESEWNAAFTPRYPNITATVHFNSGLIVENNVVYTADKTKLVCYNDHYASSFTVPSTVKIIGSHAFSGRYRLKTINLHDGIESIGAYAFYGCTRLSSVILPAGLETINEYTFYNCRGLTSVVLPEALETIKDYAFHYCAGLTDICLPENLKTIGTQAFDDCYKLEKIIFNNSLESIGDYAFQYCTSIKEISLPPSVTRIGSYAFKNCTGIDKIYLSEGITRVDEYAFYGCTNIRSIYIPKTMTTVCSYAFDTCSNLQKVYYNGTQSEYSSIYFQYYNPYALYGITITPHAEHTYGEWVTIIEPTDDEHGLKCRSCTDCGYQVSLPVPGLNHVHDNSLENPPSETKTGYKTYICSDCRNITFEPVRYTIVYNANGGTGSISNSTAYYDRDVTLASGYGTYKRMGYKCIGWSTDSSATTPEYENGQTVKNLSATDNDTVTLYAVWEYVAQNLTVNTTYSATISNGGESKYFAFTPAVSGNYSIYSTGTADTRVFLYDVSGKQIATDDDSGENRNFSLAYELTAGTTYYYGVRYYYSSNTGTINFTFGNAYTVTYDANGGTYAPESQIKSYNAALTITSVLPVRTGYTFLGWATSPSSSKVRYTAGSEYSVESDIRLYAVWKLNPVSMTENNTYTAEILYAGEKKYFTFTPYSSGYYVIYTTGANDTCVCMYNNSDNSLIAEDDDGGDFQNFRLEYYLSSGTTYKFEVAHYDESVTTPITVHFGKIFTISYNANSGTHAPESQTKDYGSSIALSSQNPVRTGYTFLGWSTSGSATSATYAAGSEYTANTNITLYAVWKANSYTISYNANGGKGTMTDSVHTYDVSTAFKANAFTRVGYTFLGWATTSTAITPEYTDKYYTINLTHVNNEVITLYAVWKPNTFYVKYNANGGKGTMENSSHTFGVAQALTANTYTRTGYVFLGWAKSKNATTPDYVDCKEVSGLTGVDGRIVNLYAIWKPITYSVSYNANGGKGTMENSNHTFGVAQALTANTYTRTGYAFLGWARTKNATTPDYVDCKEVSGLTGVDGRVVNLYAIWKPNTFYVKYNANGGNGTMENSTHTFGVAQALSANTYTRTGYTFLGWAKSKSATTPDYVDCKEVSGLTGVDGRIVNLYAIWKPITYSVKYNANGGKGTMANSSHTFGVAQALTANTYTRTGYTFLGWSKDKNATSASYADCKEVSGLTGVDGRIVNLYAIWKPIKYTVKYNANGGLGTMADSSHTYGTAKALSANKFTRTGYTFLGWAKSKSATTPDYVDGKEVSGLTGVKGKVVNLYAVWKKN